MQYSQEYDEHVVPASMILTYPDPNSQAWPVLLQSYLKSTQLFTCPSDTSTAPINPYYNQGPATAGTNFHSSYLYNLDIGAIPTGTSLASIVSPATTVAVTDGGSVPVAGANPVSWTAANGQQLWLSPKNDYTAQAGNAAAPSSRHLETANVLFADGHVKSLRVEKFYDSSADPLAGGAKMPCLDITKGCS